jgi:uncharacterized protein (DUF427 family)
MTGEEEPPDQGHDHGDQGDDAASCRTHGVLLLLDEKRQRRCSRVQSAHPVGECEASDRVLLTICRFLAASTPDARASHLPREETFVARATWNGVVIAESDDTVVVERNHYFPRESVRPEYLRPSDTQSICPWKGTASYFTLAVEGSENRDAAWYYPEPKDAAAQIRDRVAFWKGVEVTP